MRYEENPSVVNYNRNGLNCTSWTNEHGVEFKIPGLKQRAEGTENPPISDAGGIAILSVGLLAIGLILL